MKSEEKITEMSKNVLDERAARVDPELLDRLASARRQALDNIPQRAPTKMPLVFFTGAVTASILALLLYVNMPGSDRGEEAHLVSDFEFLLNEGEELDMLEQDPDFYVWLESQHEDEQMQQTL